LKPEPCKASSPALQIETLQSESTSTLSMNRLAVGILIFIRRSLPHKLFAGLWILALAEFREVLGRDRPGKAEP